MKYPNWASVPHSGPPREAYCAPTQNLTPTSRAHWPAFPLACSILHWVAGPTRPWYFACALCVSLSGLRSPHARLRAHVHPRLTRWFMGPTCHQLPPPESDLCRFFRRPSLSPTDQARWGDKSSTASTSDHPHNLLILSAFPRGRIQAAQRSVGVSTRDRRWNRTCTADWPRRVASGCSVGHRGRAGGHRENSGAPQLRQLLVGAPSTTPDRLVPWPELFVPRPPVRIPLLGSPFTRQRVDALGLCDRGVGLRISHPSGEGAPRAGRRRRVWVRWGDDGLWTVDLPENGSD
jgi:hypothetical protein